MAECKGLEPLSLFRATLVFKTSLLPIRVTLHIIKRGWFFLYGLYLNTKECSSLYLAFGIRFERIWFVHLNSLANCLLLTFCITKQIYYLIRVDKGVWTLISNSHWCATINIYTMSTNYIVMVGAIGVAPIELLKQQIYSLPYYYLRYKLPYFFIYFVASKVALN